MGGEPFEKICSVDTDHSALALAAQADTVIASAVATARDNGFTWQDIGTLLGTTRQAAFQRFGRPLDPRSGALMQRAPHLMPAAAPSTFSPPLPKALATSHAIL